MSDPGVAHAINRLSGNINGLSRDLDQLQRLQLALHQTVEQVSDNQDVTRAELNDLRRLFDEFLLRDELANNLQLAQSQVIAVVQELDGKYGHFAEVRRLATGTLQGMDSGIVTQETMQGTAEELMITTPRYWLAPALVALAAWIRDDQLLAERALGEALSRDNDKTALFFALVLRRHRRDAATARWLRQYMARQDPALLSQEFTVVLDASATGALGADAKPMVMSHLHEWYERLGADPAIVAAQVTRWRQLVDGLRAPAPTGYTVLPAISPTWPLLADLYAGATVHGRAEAHFRGIFDRPLHRDPNLERRVDDILDTLVTSYDEEEAPLRRRHAELDAIIAHDGDKKAAAATVAAAAPVHDGTVDFLTLITNAGFYPDQVGASDGTQRLAVALAKDWIIEADGQLEAANLQAMPAGVDLATEGWTGRIDERASEQDLVASLSRHIDAETEAQIAAVRFDAGPFAIAGAVLAAILAVVTAANAGAGGAVFFVIVMLALGVWAGYGYYRLQPRKDHIRVLGDRRRDQACAQVRGAIAEVVDWRSAWEQEIARAHGFRTYMSALSRDAFVTGHHDHAREGVA
ncbi:hypothetical protein [Pseudonocardia endophytica]|uniref:Uncharacterized protein n=1 Tax=Pseudonocardia endophytica TaxID=401976 RepID=A0A4R1HIZ0_PSEEN|nr:hypothetical protein [Pseudonocardia endophytica]TCK22274.1 hypothetical protein EV378_6275 [Pseudonocardia endophytica]